MPSMLIITRRRMQVSADGTHEHVGWVLLSDGTTKLSREEVLRWMGQGYTFVTASAQGHSARVTAVQCRRCGYTYLRTDRDQWKDDNLDMLPLF